MACCCGYGLGGVLIRIAALAGVGLVAGMVHSARVRLVAPEPRPPQDTTAVTPPVTPQNGGVSNPDPVDAKGTRPEAPLGFHITLQQARKLFDDGTQFIDARPDHEYVLGTIPLSTHLTPGMFSTKEGADKLVYIGLDQDVVIFCSGGDCHDSENLAALMKDSGYTRLHIFTDGFPAWQQAGYEVDVPGTPGDSNPAGGN